MNIEVYSTNTCPWCDRAKAILDGRNLPYQEIDVSKDPEIALDMRERSGRQSVPQIFIDGTAIGGFEELAGMARTDQLG